MGAFRMHCPAAPLHCLVQASVALWVAVAVLMPIVSSASGAATVRAAAPAADAGILRIGSKRFTESYILAEILAQQAATAMATAPEIRQGLGNTAIVYEALRSGAIDLYPEYTGTIAREILKRPETAGDMTALNAALAPARARRGDSAGVSGWVCVGDAGSGRCCGPHRVARRPGRPSGIAAGLVE